MALVGAHALAVVPATVVRWWHRDRLEDAVLLGDRLDVNDHERPVGVLEQLDLGSIDRHGLALERDDLVGNADNLVAVGGDVLFVDDNAGARNLEGCLLLGILLGIGKRSRSSHLVDGREAGLVEGHRVELPSVQVQDLHVLADGEIENYIVCAALGPEKTIALLGLGGLCLLGREDTAWAGDLDGLRLRVDGNIR